MQKRRLLGLLLLMLCVSVVAQARAYTFAEAANKIAFFTNEIGLEADALILTFSGDVEILNVIGIGAELDISLNSGDFVVLKGSVLPYGMVQVEWELDGARLIAATWRTQPLLLHRIDVESPSARMVIIPPAPENMLSAPINFEWVQQLLPADFGTFFARNDLVITEDHQFLALGSSDPDGSIVAYLWEWSDGVTATGPIVYRAFPPLDLKSYTVTVTLTVVDDTGRTDSISRRFDIEPEMIGVAS